MAGKLTTHVLDTAHGTPAAGMKLALHRLNPDGTREEVVAATTNHDGRVDAPLLQGESMQAGAYELAFEVGEYFRAKGVALPDPAFLDTVPLRFGVADASSHYHVPLLVSPFSFSTYRGS